MFEILGFLTNIKLFEVKSLNKVKTLAYVHYYIVNACDIMVLDNIFTNVIL